VRGVLIVRRKPPAFDADACWCLASSVALRPEPFGALVYDFTTRKLSFLKSHELVAVVERLADFPSAVETMDAVGIAPSDYHLYLNALRSLAGHGVITRREPSAA